MISLVKIILLNNYIIPNLIMTSVVFFDPTYKIIDLNFLRVTIKSQDYLYGSRSKILQIPIEITNYIHPNIFSMRPIIVTKSLKTSFKLLFKDSQILSNLFYIQASSIRFTLHVIRACLLMSCTSNVELFPCCPLMLAAYTYKTQNKWENRLPESKITSLS